MYVPMYCKQVALSIQFKNWERAVHVSQHSPRLRCKPCDQTFTATVTEVDTTRQMTDRRVKWVGRQSLEYTYAEVAKQVGVDEKTVRNGLDSDKVPFHV